MQFSKSRSRLNLICFQYFYRHAESTLENRLREDCWSNRTLDWDIGQIYCVIHNSIYYVCQYVYNVLSSLYKRITRQWLSFAVSILVSLIIEPLNLINLIFSTRCDQWSIFWIYSILLNSVFDQIWHRIRIRTYFFPNSSFLCVLLDGISCFDHYTCQRLETPDANDRWKMENFCR